MKDLPKILPGLLFAIAVAALSIYISNFPMLAKLGISSAILAIVGGIIIGNTFYSKLAPICTPGINFAKQRILRLAIILFGLKLTLQDITEIGTAGILIDIAIIASTFFLTLYLGKRLFKLDAQTTVLIGSGCSICGAAAILATSPIIGGDDKSGEMAAKVSVAVSTVVVFGTIAMFIYPLIYLALPSSWSVSGADFGVYIGSTIHEVAQVAGAGAAISDEVAGGAVIAKMIRVLMLAPFLILLSLWQAKRPFNGTESSGKGKIIIPWFAVGFIIMVGVSSTGWIPADIKTALIWLDGLLLTAAMAALGLTTHYSVFKKAGYKPMLLAAVIFLWLIIGGALINFLFQWVL